MTKVARLFEEEKLQALAQVEEEKRNALAQAEIEKKKAEKERKKAEKDKKESVIKMIRKTTLQKKLSQSYQASHWTT